MFNFHNDILKGIFDEISFQSFTKPYVVPKLYDFLLCNIKNKF